MDVVRLVKYGMGLFFSGLYRLILRCALFLFGSGGSLLGKRGRFGFREFESEPEKVGLSKVVGRERLC